MTSLKEYLPFSRVWAKRVMLGTVMGMPAYLSNLAFVAILVSYVHFNGVQVLSPVVIGDIFGMGLNVLLYPVVWKMAHSRAISGDEFQKTVPVTTGGEDG